MFSLHAFVERFVECVISDTCSLFQVFVIWSLRSRYWAASEQVYDDLYHQKGRNSRFERIVFKYHARFVGKR